MKKLRRSLAKKETHFINSYSHTPTQLRFGHQLFVVSP